MQRRALLNAAGFFLFWLLVLLAGADFPPPRGFVWILVTVALCAGAVYWRVPAYVEWARASRPQRWLWALLDGIVAGLLIALPFVLGGSGEPTVTMSLFDYAIWFAVLAAVGMINSTILYAINAVISG